MYAFGFTFSKKIIINNFILGQSLLENNGWGYGTEYLRNGCVDHSDVSMVASKTTKPACGNVYTSEYISKLDYPDGIPVDWTWFHCKNTQRCIHNSQRCNLHPHPDCIYEKDGVLVAEDEEECFNEYKRKLLAERSANFICQSPFHNQESKAILSNVGITCKLL